MNADLNAAKAAKQDEFYTQLVDVEKELRHYAKHFKNKTVLCNCDDYRMSNFFQYFHDNFKNLGLKKLVTTCYKTRQTGLFDSKTEKAVWSEYDGTNLKTGNLNNDGDFRSLECIKILKQSDIIVTNPPFSLFRQYIQQLIKHGKKFLIIGNINAINNKQIFDLIKNDSLWLGASIHSGDREFEVPSNYPLRSVGFRVENDQKIHTGKRSAVVY